MKIETKIRLGAITVALNGLAALATVSPRTALATTCNPYTDCLSTSTCPTQALVDFFCNQHIPSGCTYNQGFCLAPPFNGNCPSTLVMLLCTYH